MAQIPNPTWRIVHSESSGGWGGQEARVLAEMSGFQERGCAVALLAPRPSGIYARAVQRRLEAHALPTSAPWMPWAVVRAANTLRRFRPHLVNTHSSRDGWIVGLAARVARVPWVIRTKHFDVPFPNLWLSRLVYEQLADHLLTTSDQIAARFREFFKWAESRVTCIPTGVDLEVFSPQGPKAELFAQNGQPDLPAVGMVGVLRGAKAHDVFLKAARRLGDEGFDARYVIVGEGPRRREIEQGIRDLQLGDRVLMTRHREDVPDILRALNLVVIPSRHEGVPQTGLQALAAGTPVVASRVGGIPQIIRHGETGRLVPPDDPVALADAIRESLTMRAASGAMVERGRALVEREHSLDAMLDKLDAIYRKSLPR
jgi:glycosyltransferase involved in cell wall biosynthesis